MINHTRDQKTGQFQSLGDPKPNLVSISHKELALIEHIRLLKDKYKTFSAPDGSYDQDLFFAVKLMGLIAEKGPCDGERCKKQAKFFVLLEKEAFCERCLKKKEYFRI